MAFAFKTCFRKNFLHFQAGRLANKGPSYIGRTSETLIGKVLPDRYGLCQFFSAILLALFVASACFAGVAPAIFGASSATYALYAFVIRLRFY